MITENTEKRMQARRGVAEWTGFSGKTLWDWLLLLALLAIPIVVMLGLGSLWFNQQQSQSYLMIGKTVAEQQHQTDLQIAKEQEQEAVLNAYLDQMTAFLLNNNLSGSQPTDEIRVVAKARTLAVLPRLDPASRGSVVQFLYQAGLITKGHVKVSLSGADFSGANLSGAYLSGADLSGANFSEADFTGANLSGTFMFGTLLTHAIMPDGSRN